MRLTKRNFCRMGRWRIFLITWLLAGLSGLLLSGPASAQSGCSTLYAPSNGWTIEKCATDPNIATPMNVVLNGASQGQAALIRIYHQAQSDPGNPQVAVIYASGFVRLKQNANPSPSIPFGSSFILGPAYWPNSSAYYHNPQLTQLTIDTSWLPTGPLRMQAEGTNHAFAVSYELTLPPPRDRQTRLHVTQTYTATIGLTINSTRRAEAQGFKLVQISSMFINQGGTCAGNQTDCHDSNAVRFIGSDLVRRQVQFASVTPSAFVFNSPVSLGSTWLDVLHTDDQGWQGNTPNIRIALDALPTNYTITPQGWISATTNPNDDNVGLWLHDDSSAVQSWTAGEKGQVSYWLLAQNNPPEPWAELGLRSGSTPLSFEGSYNCFLVLPGPSVTGSVTPIAGYKDTALQLQYNLGSANGNWAQIRCNFNPPLDLSTYDHLRFDWRGDPDAANSLEVGLVNPGAGQERIFARGYHHPSHHTWWGQLVIPFNFLHPWTDGTTFDPSQVSAFFISVVKDPADDVGGAGAMAIDNLNAYNVVSRSVPSTFEAVSPNVTAATAAANWLAAQQQATGLLKSWQEESGCVAHTYDQALALIVFSREGRWSQADDLVEGLVQAQNDDGSWSKSYNCSDSNLPCVHCEKWEGDIAWAIYALSRYIDLGGSHTQATTARQRAANWLSTRLNSVNGCLVIDHTEGTIDAWWAFQSAGPDYADEAAGLKNCLLADYWDETLGRFKGGQSWWQPYLDNQTWGAAFLKVIGEGQKARRALSYAGETLRSPAQGGHLFGFDGQGGPWSVWNEGMAQYIAMGGDGANDLLLELLAQQQQNGAMLGSPDEFNGGGVWTTRWHGVAPTAWLYNALLGEPFNLSKGRIWLPVILKAAP